MTPLEILALIFAVAILGKALVYLISPKGLTGMADKLFKNTTLLTVIFLVLAVVVGYYVIAALGIVAVVATVLFAHLLIGILFAQFPKQYTGMAKEILKSKTKTWLLFLIWIALAVWTLYALFM